MWLQSECQRPWNFADSEKCEELAEAKQIEYDFTERFSIYSPTHPFDGVNCAVISNKIYPTRKSSKNQWCTSVFVSATKTKPEPNWKYPEGKLSKFSHVHLGDPIYTLCKCHFSFSFLATHCVRSEKRIFYFLYSYAFHIAWHFPILSLLFVQRIWYYLFTETEYIQYKNVSRSIKALTKHHQMNQRPNREANIQIDQMLRKFRSLLYTQVVKRK